MRKTDGTAKAIAGQAGLFLLVAFLGAGALGALQPWTRIPGEVIELTQFGPALGVLTVALVWPARVRAVLAGAVRGCGGRSGALLLVTAPLVIAAAATAYGLATGDAHVTAPGALHHPFVLIVVAQLIGACGEEIGWRCFLQPLLRTRWGLVPASAAVGLVWGVWHVQVFALAPAYAAGFLLSTVSMSVVLGVALERVRGSRLLLAGGFHALVNLGMLLLMDEESGAVLPMVLFGAACLAAAVVWVWAGVRRAPARIESILEHVR
ncbi:membrane protease YdiL (CAAX protease family) [Streptomyces olivoverticillatus]|uniref:Membrane protease YdiL (CAAX protease family) n=1 Tax=Streptomyces olivoverticillatus TaxID=66427 RepID=A0A7W7LLI2_9ACTN|nr:CPBP family intramembrane glutamic endopeptidase [Streptomyces olivoverticillatus]MBB4891851.1 membrane protease YdiL (CAAX protease family) [Streptomyces olivoverticillatus]